LRVWRGSEGRVVEKRKERVEGIEKCREFFIFFIYIITESS
jgi:hypothetical protein